LAITAVERPSTQRVAACTPGMRPRFATSWPWAITTSGAPAARAASAPAAPEGKRKWAKTTSGRNRFAAARDSRTSRTYFEREPPRWLIEETSTS
jgi:hypothetical protein